MSPVTNNQEKLLVDLDDYVKEAQPDFELVGDSDIARLASVLGQAEQNNVIYSGPTGVGKTVTLLGLARRRQQAVEKPELAAAMNIPLHMVDRRYLLLDLNVLFDTDGPETIAKDIKTIFEELKKPGNNVLVIEDANDLLRGIADHQCQGLIANFMRELKHGEFQAIWMVREEAAKEKLEEVMNCHPDMKQLFTVVRKKEPEKEDILAILKARRKHLERHYKGLTIDDNAVEEAVGVTTQYPTLTCWTRSQPARAITLLDSAASTFVARGQTKPPELRKLEEQLAAIGPDGDAGEKRTLEGQIAELGDSWQKQSLALYKLTPVIRRYQNKLEDAEVKLEKLRDELCQKLASEKQARGDQSEVSSFELSQAKTDAVRDVEKEMPQIRAELAKNLARAEELKIAANLQLVMGKPDVQDYFSAISGISSADLNADETDRLLNLEANINKKVVEQPQAVKIIADTLMAGKAGLKGKKRPLGVFICLGSSGVGKSYAAEVTAEALFKQKDALTVFDMSEFMEKHKVSQLIGAPPGYAGYGEGGRLTNAVRNKPSQSILLDEVEKAHPDVFKILLQVFNDGRLSDELGTARFENTAFFLTTNIGQKLALDGKIDPETAEGQQAIKDELRGFFPQELLNRVDAFLLFNPLSPNGVIKIIKSQLADINASETMTDKGIRVHLPDADIARLVADRYRVEEGARQVKMFVENRTNLAPLLLQAKTPGVIETHYAPDVNGFTSRFVPEGAPVNQNVNPLVVTAAPAFNHA